MSEKMSSDVKELLRNNTGQNTPQKESPTEAEGLRALQHEVAAAIKKSHETSAAGEAALSDAYTKLESYATGKLPLLIKTNVMAVAEVEIQRAVAKILVPLDDGIRDVLLDVERCQVKLNKMSWNRQLLIGQITAGFVTVLICGSLVYFGLLGDMRRYANWGKKAAAQIETYPSKTREMLFEDLGKP